MDQEGLQRGGEGWEDPGVGGRLAVLCRPPKKCGRARSEFCHLGLYRCYCWQLNHCRKLTGNQASQGHDLIARQFERVWAWSARTNTTANKAVSLGNNDNDHGERSFCLAALAWRVVPPRLTRPDTPPTIGVSVSERGSFQAEFQGRAAHPAYPTTGISAGNPYPLGPKFFEHVNRQFIWHTQEDMAVRDW